MTRPPSSRISDKSLVTAFILVLAFATPFTSLWSRGGFPWYAPYLLWLGVVLLLAFAQRKRRQRDKKP
ncbi:hypothetical protein [Thiolapillus sp.]